MRIRKLKVFPLKVMLRSMLLSVLLTLSCVHSYKVTQSRTVGGTPERLVLVFLDRGIPQMQSLKDQGITFTNAVAGQIPTHPDTLYSAFQKGQYPQTQITKRSSPLTKGLSSLDPLPRPIGEFEAKSMPLLEKKAVDFFENHSNWKGLILRPQCEMDRTCFKELDALILKLLNRLKEEGILQSTLFIFSSFSGTISNPEPVAADLDPKLHQISDVGRIEIDSMIRVWIPSRKPAQINRVVQTLRDSPQIAEVYTKQFTGKVVHYIRNYRNPSMSPTQHEWAIAHHLSLVESMADKSSPDVVGLLKDRVGNFGGAQEEVQRIPLVVISPNLSNEMKTDENWIRLVDLHACIGLLMGFSTEGLEGDCRFLSQQILPSKSPE